MILQVEDCMEKRFLSAQNPEKEIRELLDMLPLQDIVNLLEKNVEELPEVDKTFYRAEIDMWGRLGDKKHLISDLIGLIPDELLSEIIDEVDTASSELFPIEGQEKPGGRYQPGIGTEEFDWGDAPAKRSPYNVLPELPGTPSVKPERERIQPHPEKDYIKEDLWEELTPPGPPPPQVAIPDFSAMDASQQEEYKELMIDQIHTAVRTAGQTNLPFPYLAEMMARYLDAVDPELLSKLIDAGVFSRSRFGFRWETIVKNMFRHPEMTLEDLYLYWNAIVNERMLPWVNGDWTVARYGGGARGKNIGPMFNEWGELETPEAGLEFPENVEFTEKPAPAWHSEVRGPVSK